MCAHSSLAEDRRKQYAVRCTRPSQETELILPEPSRNKLCQWRHPNRLGMEVAINYKTIDGT